MKTILNKDLKEAVENSKTFCEQEGIEIVFTYELSEEQLKDISDRSGEISALYQVSVKRLQERLENGCFLLIKDGLIFGHIFAHKHIVGEHAVFERSTLWIASHYRKHNLGLLLMHLLTERYTNNFLISIAREPKVHHYNELLGMNFVTLNQMSEMLVDSLEKIGKLRDELLYKYYVNDCFANKIGHLE